MPTVSRFNLTLAKVERALPEAKPYWLRDSQTVGLALRVNPTGRKAWYVHYGRGLAQSLGTWPGITLDAARAQARLMLAEIEELGAPRSVVEAEQARLAALQPGALTLGAFIAKHYAPWVRVNRKSGALTAQRLESAFADLLDKPLGEIDAAVIDAWKTARKRARRTPATINRDLAALKAAFAMAVRWKLAERVLGKDAEPDRAPIEKRVRFLSTEERGRLLQALEARNSEMIEARARTLAGRRQQHADLQAIPAGGFADVLTPLVLVALNTGCRRGELTGLRWADVDLRMRQLTVRADTSKGGKSRVIPLNDVAVDALTRWQRQNSDDRVFPVQDPKKAWAGLLERAKVEAFRFHDCRHDFASRLAMAGVPLAVIRDLLGHATIAMTERYAHLCPSYGADAVAKLVTP